MGIVERNLKTIVQVLLLAVIAVIPFIKVDALYFPFVSGKAYLFRVLVAVAFFFWVWLLLKDQGSRFKVQELFKNILVIAIVLFFLAQLISAFFGVDPVYSLFSSIERAEGVVQYGFWVLYFLMFLSVFREKRDWQLFFPVFIGVAFIFAVHAWTLGSFRAQESVAFGNPAYFAAFLLFAISFSLLIYERKLFYPGPAHHALLAVAGFLTITLIAAQVRGVYMGLAGGVFVFAVLSLLFLRREQKRLAMASGSVLLVGAVSLAIIFAAKDTDFVKNTRLLWRITEVAEFWESDSVRERVLNWNIALKAFKERPLFGYGPENFGAAANKYYDYRIGKGEPWFDRAHNQALDTLATTGIVGFSFYLFWLGAAGFAIFSIARREKVLGFLLAGIFVAYFLQGFFLFDLLAVYLGLFPFLAFLVYQFYELRMGTNIRIPDTDGGRDQKINQHPPYSIPYTLYIVFIPVAIASLAVIYFTAVVPWRANAAVFQFFAHTERGFYEQSKPFLEKSLAIHSPYTTWEVRKRAGWQLSNRLEYEVHEDTKPETRAQVKDLYELIVPELEKFIEARPTDPQMYYVLGRMYRLGSEKLGYNDLDKAAAVFKKSLEQSRWRIEYYNEFAKVLLLQGKVEDAEQLLLEYTGRIPIEWGKYFPSLTMGHFYFAAEQYEKAFEQYENARGKGYQFVEIVPEYSRYMFVVEETKNYEKVVEMAKAYLARWGPSGDSYFNIAVGYFNLGDKETSKEFFSQAIELKPELEEYLPFFE